MWPAEFDTAPLAAYQIYPSWQPELHQLDGHICLCEPSLSIREGTVNGEPIPSLVIRHTPFGPHLACPVPYGPTCLPA